MPKQIASNPIWNTWSYLLPARVVFFFLKLPSQSLRAIWSVCEGTNLVRFNFMNPIDELTDATTYSAYIQKKT